MYICMGMSILEWNWVFRRISVFIGIRDHVSKKIKLFQIKGLTSYWYEQIQLN